MLVYIHFVLFIFHFELFGKERKVTPYLRKIHFYFQIFHHNSLLILQFLSLNSIGNIIFLFHFRKILETKLQPLKRMVKNFQYYRELIFEHYLNFLKFVIL